MDVFYPLELSEAVERLEQLEPFAMTFELGMLNSRFGAPNVARQEMAIRAGHRLFLEVGFWVKNAPLSA